MSRLTKKVLAGLDIGSTKVTCTVGTPTEEGLDVTGVGEVDNTGVRQGVVVNIESVSSAIRQAKEEAELMAGTEVSGVWVGVGGSHIRSFDSQGMVAVKNEEVTDEDVQRVIEAAKAVAIPQDRQILHVLPQDYIVDEQTGIADPVGMSGVRLECSVHIVTGNKSALQNAMKCTEKAGLQVNGLVLQPLASARAVLNQDEKNLGVSLIDMGGGICELVTFAQGSVVHTAQIPVGGQNFTHDIAMGLRTTQANAEMLKKKYGSVLSEAISEDDVIEVDSVGGGPSRTVSKKNLCYVIGVRAEETLAFVKQELADKGLMERLGSGLVVTGGAGLLHGLIQTGEFTFDAPVRLGVPMHVGGLTDVIRSTNHAAAVGLLLYGLEQQKDKKTGTKAVEADWGARISSWTRRLKELFS